MLNSILQLATDFKSEVLLAHSGRQSETESDWMTKQAEQSEAVGIPR